MIECLFVVDWWFRLLDGVLLFVVSYGIVIVLDQSNAMQEFDLIVPHLVHLLALHPHNGNHVPSIYYSHVQLLFPIVTFQISNPFSFRV